MRRLNLILLGLALTAKSVSEVPCRIVVTITRTCARMRPFRAASKMHENNFRSFPVRSAGVAVGRGGIARDRNLESHWASLPSLPLACLLPLSLSLFPVCVKNMSLTCECKSLPHALKVPKRRLHFESCRRVFENSPILPSFREWRILFSTASFIYPDSERSRNARARVRRRGREGKEEGESIYKMMYDDSRGKHEKYRER